MPVMHIYPDIEGKTPHLRDKTAIEIPDDDVHYGALPQGMVGGRASVAILAELPDGKSYAFIQNSLANFIGLFVALHARYPDEFRAMGVIVDVTLVPPGKQ